MFCFKKTSNILILAIILSNIVFLTSCNKDDSHPITRKFWIDKVQNRLIKFDKNGKVKDLYNFSNTNKDSYTIEGNSLTIYHRVLNKIDTAYAEIIEVSDSALILKYRKSAKPDTLQIADRNHAIIGTWIPSFDSSALDTFEITRKKIFDSYKIDKENMKEYFRYKFINDSIIEFNYFEKGISEKYTYTLSTDNLLLLLSQKKNTISLQRK